MRNISDGCSLGLKRYGNSFDESKIKRDGDGKFSTTGGGGGGAGESDSGGGSSKTSKPEKERKEIRKTETGKPIYEKTSKKEISDWSEDEHIEAIQALGSVQENLSWKYHKTGNPDGTISQKQIIERKRIKKQIEAIVKQKEMHRSIVDPSDTPDQKDFDKMDRENDPKKRSKSWK